MRCAAHGVARGDRVAILLPQSPEVAAIHVAIYKLGAIALPLASLFGVDALRYRLRQCGREGAHHQRAGPRQARRDPRRVCRTSRSSCRSTAPPTARSASPTCVARAASDFAPVATAPDDPAMMIYTSGTTGQPKGALHAHRVLLGHLPGIELPHDFFPQPGDRFWTPADWAWAGGLLDCLLPSLHYGVPVVARRFDKFDPEEAFDLMAKAGVRNAFIPPTALRMLRSAPQPARAPRARRCAPSARAARRSAPRPRVGQVRARPRRSTSSTARPNAISSLSSCALIGVSQAGRHRQAGAGPHGRGDPPRRLALCAPGELGQVAVKRPDPVMFLEYWGKPDATREKFIGDWMTTGDQGVGRRATAISPSSAATTT